MRDDKRLFQQAIQQALGSQPNWDRLEIDSIIRQYKVSHEQVLEFRDCIYSLKRFFLFQAAVLPPSPGILALATAGVPCGVRYLEGTHVPYPIQFVCAENLRMRTSVICQGDNPPEYVSYALVPEARHRQIFVQLLDEQLKLELQRPVPAFVPARILFDQPRSGARFQPTA